MSVNPGDNLSIKLVAFSMKVAGFWTSDTSRGDRLMRFATISALIAHLILIYIVLIDIYYCHGTFEELSNGLLNISIAGVALFKLIVLMPHRQKFLDLISYATKNFWYGTYDSTYSVSIMNNCLKKCAYMVIFISVMCSVILFTFAMKPLIVDRGKNVTERSFPVQLHLKSLPIFVTPWYEIIYMLQVPPMFYCTICFLCFDNFLCGINMTLVGQFRILQNDLRNIYDHTDPGIDENVVSLRFNTCVRKHQELIACADRVKELYKNLVLGFVLFLSMLICMELFQVMTFVDQLFLRMRAFICAFNTTGQLYLFTLTCNSLTEVSLEISDAAYDVQWFSIKSDRVKKKLLYGLKTVIMRSQKPCQLTVGNFTPVTLKTFTSICNMAFTFLTLIRSST